MAMNELELLSDVLDAPAGREIFVDPALADRAMKPLDRMLSFAQSLNTSVVGRA
jgi:quinolinate synthase